MDMDKVVTYITQYYGTDWLAVICMCVYLWRVGNKKRDAFVWGALSSAFFVVDRYRFPLVFSPSP